jgi:AraC family transcriptional activator of mtrCDE
VYNEVDIFRELAPLLQVRPELQQICRFGGQWKSTHQPEPGHWAPFHIVVFGECLLDVRDRSGILLRAGDAAVLPHGGPHVVRALPNAAGPTSVLRVQRRLFDEILVKSNVYGEPDTRLICGRLCFEHPYDNMVLAALPSVVVLAAAEESQPARFRRIVDAIRDELEEDRLGGASVAAALVSSLMIMILSARFQNESESDGILALLRRRQTAKAVGSMLAEPARCWTLEELAERANTSRATLVRLFQAAVDKAPIAFLSELRLTLARRRVLATKESLAVIAEGVGYQSEAAFSRAYHWRFGIAPGADRIARLTSLRNPDARPP